MVLIAAVDRSDHASVVVREAAELARRLETELHVVHVLDQQTFLALERTTVSKSGRPVSMDDIRSTAANIAAKAAESVTTDFEAVGLVGNVAKQLLTYAASHDATYIVVGGRKRSPVEKIVFGSVTQRVLLDAECPVVVTAPSKQ